jgi:hypothetical protein
MFCRVILTVTAVLLSTAAAQAGPVFGNGDLSNTGDSGGLILGNHDYYAVSFKTGSSSPYLTLSGGYILIGNTVSVSSSVDTQLEIWSDAGSGPAARLFQSSIVNIPANTPNGWLLLNFASPVTLTASTNYYAVFGKITAPATTLRWHYPATSSNYTDLGSGSGYTTTPTAKVYGSLNNDPSWAPYLSETLATAPLGIQLVPEPSSAMLLTAFSGIVACVGLARRRRVRA